MSQSKPIQIYKLEGRTYRIDLPAIYSIFDKVGDRKVAIYSINGPLRMGKSFMLSFFLKYLSRSNDWINYNLQSTFVFRAGTQRETTGIFMWSDPFIIKRDDGTEVALLLMDTQGSFDNQTTMQDNAIVFALSTLLSSFIIFNITRQISEEMLQFMQYFAGFARLADEENQDEPFQKLVFLIRDWMHPDYDYGYYDETNSIGGKNFKIDYLNSNQSQPMEVKYVHDKILETFSEVGCYLMPYPGSEVARNSNFDQNRVEQDFLQHLLNFVPLMLNTEQLILKKIGGSYITGNQLKKFVERWATIFRSDALPPTKSVYAATVELQYEMAKAAATENYARRMKDAVVIGQDVGLEHDILEEIHRQVFTECVQLYKSFKKIADKDYDQIYTNKIQEEINAQYQYFVQLNNGNIRIKEVQKTMDEKCEVLRKQSENNMQKLEKVKQEYDEKIKAQEKEREKLKQETAENRQKLEQVNQRYVEELNKLKEEECNKLRQEREEIKNRLDQVNQKHSEELRRVQEEIRNTNNQLGETRREQRKNKRCIVM